MERSPLNSTASLISRASEWLVLLFLLVASTPIVLVRHRALTLVPKLDLLDGSWLLDTSYKAAGGIWFGRDVAFTYGPLFQWLSSAPSRWTGLSTGAVYATWYTLPFYIIILATFMTARLLLPEAAAWRRALLVLLAVVYWSPPDLRVSFCLLAFAIYVRLADAAAVPGAVIVLRALAAAIVFVVGFLLSADTGLYCVAALLLCLGAAAVGEHGSRELFRFLLAAVVWCGILVLAINAIMFSPFDFSFWRSSLTIAAGYRWFEPIAMAKADKHLVMKVIAFGSMVFFLSALGPKLRRSRTARTTFLLAGFCLGLLMLQSALVRSDHGHVIIGIYPIVFFCGAIALDRLNLGPVTAGASALGLAIVTLLLAVPFPMFRPANVWVQLREFENPVVSCPENLHLLDQACFSAEDARFITATSSFVDSNSKPGQRIAVFPYQTAFGLLSRRQIAGGLMQSYLADGDYLSRLELSGLERAMPGVALYFPDGVSSLALDGVPNFTRSPELWLYYQRHYRSGETGTPGTATLLRDDSREARIRTLSEPVGDSMSAMGIHARSTEVDLGQVHWPAAGADFLKLRLRVDYPWWWRLRKPSCLTLQVAFSDGSQSSLQFVAPPGRDTDVWVYPWSAKDLSQYFAVDESHWRTGSRPIPTGLTLLVTPFDWISVAPTSVSLKSIEAVRLDLQ